MFLRGIPFEPPRAGMRARISVMRLVNRYTCKHGKHDTYRYFCTCLPSTCVLPYHAVHPPSTTTLFPVIYEDASEARNNSAPFISSFCAMRPRMVLAE